MVWHHVTVHRRLPPLINAHLYHFRWQLCQIACHFPYISQNKRRSLGLHYSSWFAAIEMYLFGLHGYCKSSYCFKFSCADVPLRLALQQLLAPLSPLFTCSCTRICCGADWTRWQVTIPLTEGGPSRTVASFRSKAQNSAPMAFTRTQSQRAQMGSSIALQASFRQSCYIKIWI